MMKRTATRTGATRAAPSRSPSSVAPPPAHSQTHEPQRKTERLSSAPLSSPSSSSTASSSASAPPFGRLLSTAFRSVGIDYISLDHLRKAKKNALNGREYSDLWRLLHDLVVIVLVDFDIDVDAIRSSSSPSPPTTSKTTLLLPVYQELVRVYLFDWGFVCSAFYTEETPAASVLLLALAWLLAYSQFVERQHDAILQLYLDKMSSSPVQLPPYPNDVSLSASAVHSAVDAAVADYDALYVRLTDDVDSQADAGNSGKLHQLQALVGRIYAHNKALQSAQRYHTRMLTRLRETQLQSGAVEEEEEELLPAYALQVFAQQNKSHLELHMRIISERLQMVEDEKLFYKWINSLLLQYTPAAALQTQHHQQCEGDGHHYDHSDTQSEMERLSLHYHDLYAEMQHTQSKMDQTMALCRQIASLHAQETQKWRQKPKTRTQQVKMDEKMDKLSHEIAVNELWDATTMLLDLQSKPRGGGGGKKSSPSIKKETPVVDLQRLQQELERVMQEITSEYCRVELK